MGTRNNSIFVRVLIFLFIVFLIFLVLTSFYRNAIPFDFNAGLITVLLIITLLILSEAFDNLSIGKLFSLSREVKQKEEEVEKSKEENKELREKIISLASVVTQNQSNHNYFGFPIEYSKGISVVKAEKDAENAKIKSNALGSEFKSTPNLHKLPLRVLLNEGLNMFIERQKIPTLEVIKEAEFSSNFKGIDPIDDQRILFDAYYKTDSKEYFIEIFISTSYHPLIRYQIYSKIAKILFYQQVKKTSAEMILVFINVPESLNNGKVSRNANVGDIFKQFQPAIYNGLLRIESIDLSEDDIKNIQKKYEVEKE
ncbi:hypothetical protein CN514_12365 [Bacillus sp. AFS001701]|uniref:hypothetical protein n=1 Tax=Bacillus sp. AFS001701 TaxID=2033480 RepID=UPI000BF758A6|nr:hypothetical protein [Bacillus sp. AFS001701]PET65157.1 hypothetical protein CN514_12365 [Bacillus sp. AFS001701]